MPAEQNHRVAIVMLACRDYESMEVALACHMAYRDEEFPLFILLNCKGGYDAHRVRGVAKRYKTLFPKTIHLIDHYPPDVPYLNIAKALKSPALEPYSLIFKVDDDAFPISPGWLGTLLKCWNESEERFGQELAYLTPLINNNTWGFAETMKVFGLESEYYERMAREHCVGLGSARYPLRVLPPHEIETGGYGTIWANPYLARWIHEHSSLDPDRFVALTEALEPTMVPAADRYSISGILFRKELWSDMSDGSNDDEHMLHQYCKARDKKIVCVRSVPFVHLAYFSQREENRDIVERCRPIYAKRTGHPFPITLYEDRTLELEARMRWTEQQGLPRRRKSSISRRIRASIRLISDRIATKGPKD